ncbi:DUF3016 domain-containing protein [Aestuariibacter salexigens]|uniref:DUF3016 domain-containing protein n=1 Tax=Aestuariibacter salexigens TaxID=226010 RepID=UPI00041E2437|nr:DUF3016 domain-containing protein [Aestuariibacter salexigens]
MIRFSLSSLITSLVLLSGAAFADNHASHPKLDINWENPKEYSDVRPSNESRSRFRDRTLASLEKYIGELSNDLPDGFQLKMNVTDIDLAGQVWPASFVGLGNGGTDVRMIKRIDIPRMDFSYELVDANGKVVKSEQVDLKDMSFQDRFNPLFDDDPYRYEKNMLREWFKKTFADMVSE